MLKSARPINLFVIFSVLTQGKKNLGNVYKPPIKNFWKSVKKRTLYHFFLYISHVKLKNNIVMTQEDKQLLLIDLSARLPYGVIVQYPNIFRPSEVIKKRFEEVSCYLIGIDEYRINLNDDGIDIEYVKPYLRQLSSMTEEEEVEYDATFDTIYINGHYYSCMSYKSFDFLNKKMFDYRDLIPMGLALPAPEGMY